MSLFASALGAATQGAFGLLGQGIQYGQQQQMVSNAEQYNTQMADTVYSRGVADMQAAGLNPVLAAGSPDPMASAPAMSGAGAGSISSPVGPMPNLTPSQDAQVQAQTLASTSQAASNLVDAHLTQTKDQLAALDLPKAERDADWYSRASGSTLGLWDDVDRSGIGQSSALGAGLSGGLAGYLTGQSSTVGSGTAGPNSAAGVGPANPFGVPELGTGEGQSPGQKGSGFPWVSDSSAGDILP